MQGLLGSSLKCFLFYLIFCYAFYFFPVFYKNIFYKIWVACIFFCKICNIIEHKALTKAASTNFFLYLVLVFCFCLLLCHYPTVVATFANIDSNFLVESPIFIPIITPHTNPINTNFQSNPIGPSVSFSS